jgi:hypothetical protein
MNLFFFNRQKKSSFTESGLLPNKYFIAVYTNQVKDYCDDMFFNRLSELYNKNEVHIVDNSKNNEYYLKLKSKWGHLENFRFYYLEEPLNPAETLFHRRVTESVLLLRKTFLQTSLLYFMIIESDVIPPADILTRFDNDISILNKKDKNWGVLAALYHRGFDNFKRKNLHRKYHVLSGCTVYKRALIEKYPFRWSLENFKAFPDAWICWDAKHEYKFYNDHNIICGHVENQFTGTRRSKES